VGDRGGKSHFPPRFLFGILPQDASTFAARRGIGVGAGATKQKSSREIGFGQICAERRTTLPDDKKKSCRHFPFLLAVSLLAEVPLRSGNAEKVPGQQFISLILLDLFFGKGTCSDIPSQ
jgi:hypothetical protein